MIRSPKHEICEYYGSDKKAAIRALSVRQPWANDIINGTKTIEFRTVSTNIREQVFIYASKTMKTAEKQELKTRGLVAASYVRGAIIGVVTIQRCIQPAHSGDYQWHLVSPRKFKTPLLIANRPQPVWFRPKFWSVEK